MQKTPENYKNETTKEHFISSSNKIQFRIPEILQERALYERNKQTTTLQMLKKRKEKGGKKRPYVIHASDHSHCNPKFSYNK